MIVTMLLAAVSLSRMLLRRLLMGWVFAVALRAEPCKKLYATDASPSGAGTQEPRLALYALTEEKAKRVRLDWKGEEVPSNMHDGSPAAALLGLGLEWAELDLLRETLSASAHTAGKHVGTLDSLDAFSKKETCLC